MLVMMRRSKRSRAARRAVYEKLRCPHSVLVADPRTQVLSCDACGRAMDPRTVDLRAARFTAQSARARSVHAARLLDELGAGGVCAGWARWHGRLPR